MATDLRQTHFRFGKDDGTEITHTFWQNEDVNHTQLVDSDWTFLLRFTEQESGATAAANTDAVFQYNKNGAGWVDITISSSVVKAVPVNAFADGANCTKRLSGTGTFETTGAGCTEDGSSGGNANDIVASGNSETECGLQVVAADVANGDTIQFRFRSPDWTVTYTITPTLTIQKTGPTILTVQDGILSHLLDVVVLILISLLTVAEANHSHTTDPITLSQLHNLTIQEANHSHTIDPLTLIRIDNLITQEANHNHLADNVILESGIELVVQEASHNHSIDGILLSQLHNLSVQESNHSQTTDSILLAQLHNLISQETSHLHSIDSVDLILTYVLLPDEILHSVITDNIILQLSSTLTVQETNHLLTSDNVKIPIITRIILRGFDIMR